MCVLCIDYTYPYLFCKRRLYDTTFLISESLVHLNGTQM